MTTGAILRRVNIPLLLQLGSNLLLRFTAGGFPIEVKNLIDRAQVFFRVSMALQAPTHGQRFMLIHDIHMIDVAVTTDTANASINVNRVIEVSEIGDLMDPHPVHGLSGFPALLNRPKLGIVLLHLLVAVHAGLSGRYVRSRGNLDVAVTIPTIQA